MDVCMADPGAIETLAKQARAGDRGAFEHLAALHKNRLLASIRARGRHHGMHAVDAEEVATETLLRALESIGGFESKGPDSFLRWLFGISRHVQIDAVRGARSMLSLVAADGPWAIRAERPPPFQK